MIRLLIIAALFVSCGTPFAQAQKKPGHITGIEVRDNRNSLLMEYFYRITSDSLVIRGRTEREHPVNYVARTWERKEKKRVRALMMKTNPEYFQDTYSGGFTNMKFISAENYPRILQIKFEHTGGSKEVKVTNVYVPGIATIISEMNTLLPAETSILYQAVDFEKPPETQPK